jgi:hypothetical protein
MLDTVYETAKMKFVDEPFERRKQPSADYADYTDSKTRLKETPGGLMGWPNAADSC